MMNRASFGSRNDALIAALLAIVLAAAATWRGWADLSALRLPDSDDVMRLQQIRDWLAGQAFRDVTQYRLGPSGTAMHWSRLDDLVPAAMIHGLSPILGRHGAEIATVIAWPTMLLAAAIMLVGRIAISLGGAEAGWRAMILTAVAHPANTLFVPGRIDHHNLQMVLALIMVLAIVGAATFRAGIASGVAAGLSLIVGLETAPLVAGAAGLIVLEWIWRGDATRPRLLGFGLGLGACTLAGALLFGTSDGGVAQCDGFTAIAARAAGIAAAAIVALSSIRSETARGRVMAVGLAGVLLIGASRAWAPQCLSPYGNVDPTLQRLWLARVGEAAPLLAAPTVTAIGYAGLMIAGIIASAWQVTRTRARGWIALLVLQLVALLVTFAQIRGAYPGALLAIPALAATIVSASRSGGLALAGAWVIATGMTYPFAASALPVANAPGKASTIGKCVSPELLKALNGLRRGIVMAPIDTGGPAIAATPHRLIAGAYHRNNAGNLAMYHFYLGSPDNGLEEARRLAIDYVIFCDGLGVPAPATSLAHSLEARQAPNWLDPIAAMPDGATLYRVRPPRR